MNKYVVLVDQAERVRQEVKDLIDAFPPDKREEILFDEWSLKDVIAHLSTWMVHDIDCIKCLIMGTEPFWEPDVEEFNRRGVDARKSKDWEEVYREFINLIEESNQMYRQLPESLWQEKIWNDKDETVVKFLEEEVEHWGKEHLSSLEEGIKRVTR